MATSLVGLNHDAYGTEGAKDGSSRNPGLRGDETTGQQRAGPSGSTPVGGVRSREIGGSSVGSKRVQKVPWYGGVPGPRNRTPIPTSLAEAPVTVGELLQRPRPEDESPLTYTEKQVDILQAAINNMEMTPEELSSMMTDSAEFPDASPTYVRNTCLRAERSEMTDNDVFAEIAPEPEMSDREPPQQLMDQAQQAQQAPPPGQQATPEGPPQMQAEGEIVLHSTTIPATIEVRVDPADVEAAMEQELGAAPQ